ncbi:MAG TPA: glycosyltransferase family 2 protein [Patescibacteria group bacterium]|nr:glycosyltransferase family 2 protein [Patescibacteria group bacterium]
MQKDFSIVIPVLNEEESVRELVQKIKQSFARIKKTYEIIFVDDGSTDKTLEVLKLLKRDNREIKIYSFRKNLGKSPALMLGFEKASGKYIVTLDGDLQDDPVNITALHHALTKGNFDLVTGWRKDRKDGSIKRISSKIFNGLVSILFGTHLNDLNSGLKIYNAEAAKELKIYGGMHRFIPLILSEMGYKVSEYATVHHERKYGVSKYKFSKIFTDIPDLVTIYFITKYNRRPLHFFGKIGGVSFLIGLIMLGYLSILHFEGHRIGNRPLLIFGALFVLAGIQTIFTGLIADLVVNFQTKGAEEFPIKYSSEATQG